MKAKTRHVLLWLLLAAAATPANQDDLDRITRECGPPARPFPAVHYWKLARNKPRPLKLYLLRIALDNPRVSFLVTPPPETVPSGRDTTLLRTSVFAAATKARIAVNLSPWRHMGLDGFPADICGLAASAGRVYSENEERFPAFNITADNQVRIGPAADVGKPFNAAAGFDQIVTRGKKTATGWRRHPRTALGVDREGRTLILLVVDGRQPDVSEGVTIPELADLMISFGAFDALNLDGGGSSTLVFQQRLGRPEIQNIPVGYKNVPRTERSVANHLAVFIRDPEPEDGPQGDPERSDAP
jgi:hypothetical protein